MSSASAELIKNLTISNNTNFSFQLDEHDTLNKIFVITLVCLIAIANVLMGCEIELNIVISTLKRPTSLFIGAFTQFIIMPLLSYAISYIILMSRGLNMFAIGLFVTGCCPSGSASNLWTILLDGNANLSITMTFFSMMISLISMPLWMNLLGHKFFINTNAVIQVPYGKIVCSLLLMIIPLLLGTIIYHYRPHIASKAKKLIQPFFIFVLAFVIIFGILSNLFLLKLITWPPLLAGLLLPWCGFMFGCFTSILFRREPKDVTAVAIETGVQNTGIAIMLLKLSFPGGEGSEGMLLPIIVACFTPAPLLLGYAVHSAIKALKKRKKEIPISFCNGHTSAALTPVVNFNKNLNRNNSDEFQPLN